MMLINILEQHSPPPTYRNDNNWRVHRPTYYFLSPERVPGRITLAHLALEGHWPRLGRVSISTWAND